MIVELVGLPGSGKSTFARTLEKGKRWTSVRIQGRSELLWYAALFIVQHPISTLWQLYYLCRYGSQRALWYTKFVNLFLVYNAKFMKAGQYNHAIVDQGHLQNVISLFETVMPREVMLHYVAVLPKPDLTVYFDIPSHIRKSRIQGRGHGVREDVAENVRAQWEEASEVNFGVLLHAGATAPSRIVVEDADLEELSTYLAAPQEIYYVLSARMPTEKAYGNQTAVTCQELARLGARVELWAPKRANPITTSVHEYYGLKKYFITQLLPSHEFLFVKRISKRLGYYVDAIAFLLYLAFRTLPEGASVMVRKPEVAWLMKTKGLHVVYECHDWFGKFARIELALLRGVDRIVVTNSFIRQRFIEKGFDEKVLTVLPNAVDLSIFARDESKEEARHKLDLGKQIPNLAEKKLLLYTGSLRTMQVDKGVSDILRALVLIREQSVFFCAVGGSPEDIAHYERMAGDLGVADRVRFLPRASKNDLALFQRASDILLMPFPKKAHYEYFMSPLKTFEYMASGRPIIASTLPSILEVLGKDSALFCEPENPADLAEKIKQLLADPELSARLALGARRDVGKYDLTERAKQLLTALTWHKAAGTK